MSNINPKELQKFYDIWAPMINSLPTVINAVATHEELQRSVEVLRARVSDAESEAQAHKDAARDSLVRAKEELKALAAEKMELTKSIKTHAKECADACAELDAGYAEQQERHAARLKVLADEMAAAQRAAADKVAQAEAGYAQVLAAKLAEAKELEARVSKAQDALYKLRAKLD